MLSVSIEPPIPMHGSRNFSGGGGPGPTVRKQSGQRFFCIFLVLSVFYSLQRGSNGFIIEKTILYQGRGGPTFSRGGGGSNFFPGGIQMLISIETHIIMIFQGGPDPYPPSGSALGSFDLKSNSLPLSHCAPQISIVVLI